VVVGEVEDATSVVLQAIYHACAMEEVTSGSDRNERCLNGAVEVNSGNRRA